MDHREASRIGAGEPGPRGEALERTAARPFARLVGAPGTRRVALQRVVLASAAGAALLALLLAGGSMAVQSMVAWLHAQPDYQVAFSEIALDPDPPPWIKSGRLGLLEHVRDQAGQPRTLALLDLDLPRLERAFALHSGWVKRVSVRRAYPRSGQPALTVRLEYRRPVALCALENHRLIVVDEEGYVLPADDLDRTAAGPLIQLSGIPASRFWGTPQADDDLTHPDPHVAAAARLAVFLQQHQPSGRAGAWQGKAIVVLHSGDSRGLFAQTADTTLILWGDPPDAEKPGDLTAAQKWAMLAAWVEAEGKTRVEHPDYLEFTRHGVRRHAERHARGAEQSRPNRPDNGR